MNGPPAGPVMWAIFRVTTKPGVIISEKIDVVLAQTAFQAWERSRKVAAEGFSSFQYAVMDEEDEK